MGEEILSKNLVPKTDADGSYVYQTLPFGYKGSVSVGPEFFGSGASSVRLHFMIPSSLQTVSTLFSSGSLSVTVTRGYGVVSSTNDSTHKVEFSLDENRYYDLVLTAEGGMVRFYINGHFLGDLAASWGSSGVVNSSSTPTLPSVVYMLSSWSRVLSPSEIMILFSLAWTVDGVDYMGGVREGMLSEFLPVNILEGTWWNTVSGDTKHNIGGLDVSKVLSEQFIYSEGSWEAAGKAADGDWVKVRFYNKTFFGSQVCYVGLKGFRGVPAGLGTLRTPLIFTTRPIYDSPLSASATSTLVVDVAGGQNWSAPQGVSLVVKQEDGSAKLVPAWGALGSPITDYVEIDVSGSASWQQSYTNDAGVVRTESFTLDDITNVSYSFTYYDYFGESITWPSITVGTRGEVVGPVEVVGEVIMTYYVHGVMGKTAPVYISQQANDRWVEESSVTLDLSATRIAAEGGSIFYKALYGYTERWTSLAYKTHGDSVSVKTDKDWVTVSSASVPSPWTGVLSVAPYMSTGERTATVSTNLSVSGVLNKSMQIVQTGKTLIGVPIYITIMDNSMRDTDEYDRFLWWVGNVSWQGVDYSFNSDHTPYPLVSVKGLSAAATYGLGSVQMPEGTTWSDISVSLSCGTVVASDPANPSMGRGNQDYSIMEVRVVGYNTSDKSKFHYLSGYNRLSAAPYAYYPDGVGEPVRFVSASGDSSQLDLRGGYIEFQILKYSLIKG